MDFLARYNEAINYIESTLAGDFDLSRAASIAVCSPFHFQRMFTYLVGVPLGEYIRRRRMTMAAFDLAASDEKVIDVSLKYGYDSPTAFTRAFRAVHGIAPSEARKEGVKLVAFPRISLIISIKGDMAMDYRIEKKDAFRIVGVKTPLSKNVESNFEEVPAFWAKAGMEGVIPRLCALMDGSSPAGILGVCSCMSGSDYSYYIAAATNKSVPDGMAEYTLPAATWAVFTSIGANPAAIQETQQRIVREWLPSSGFEYADAPDMEVYFEGDQSSSDYRCEVWIPVTKKN